MTIQQDNPLLNISSLPNFSLVRVEHIVPAVEYAIENCKKTIINAVEKYQNSPTWDNVMNPIEEADDKFSKIWSVISHLNAVKNNKEFRAEHDKCLPLIAQYSSFAGQYKPLYEVLVKIAKSDAFNLLTAAQRKSIENSLRDFKLSGVDLSEEKKQQYVEIQTKLSQLTSDFANNVLDATQSFFVNIKEDELDKLKGLPQSALDLAKQTACTKGCEGYVFTLDLPSYLPIISYAHNRELRQQMYEAYVTRASDKGPQALKFDNTQNINEILKLRHKLAKLLGFESYAHLSLASKMAKDPKEVIDFLELLANKSKARALEQMQQLRDFAKEQDGIEKLEPYDVAYYSEKLKQKLYSYNDELLRQYFPVDKVINGLFECAKRVFSISFRPRLGVDVWHEDVKCFDVYDKFDARIGSFYLDLYAREGKRGGAWMDECMSRRYRQDGALQLPVAYLVCNFSAPVANKTPTLTHDEVVTLFHEFGHGLNLLLTRVDIADVSGINGVPWDAVELPSQFNENFAWQEEVLNFLSSNINDGSPLPKDKLEALLKAKNYLSAMMMLRQIEFALFDFRIHLEYNDEAADDFVAKVLADVRAQVSVTPQYKDNRFAHSFNHIFAGGYAAGYYSYKWAEVLAADAFAKFEEEGIFNKHVGDNFRDYIMAVGGSIDPMKAFIAFRGRKPDVNALLKQSGIID